MTTWIQTRGRRRLDLLDPSPEQVDWSDVALGLARTARFSGQTSRRYSVAEHSLRVGVLCGPARLAGLLHDAHEAYLGDWTSPLKAALGELSRDGLQSLQAIERGVLGAICDALDLAAGGSVGQTHGVLRRQAGIVRSADLALLATEARDLLPGGPREGWTERLGERPLRGTNLSRIGTFVSLGMRVDPEQPIASAWLFALEQAAGLAPGALVPLATGAGHYEHSGDEGDPGVDTWGFLWLGMRIPRRRWSGPVSDENKEVPGGDR